MAKKLFHLKCLIYITMIFSLSESQLVQRQKMALSLSQDFYIKNVILIKESQISDISFAKLLSQSNIYFSSLTSKELQLKIKDFINLKVNYLKTLILTFNEEYNDIIYEAVSFNESGASKFLWLVWNNQRNRKINVYIPYNTQLLFATDDIEKNYSKAVIKEYYHPRIFTPTVFQNPFGNWSENKGFEVFEKDLYERRLNMKGTKLDVLFDPRLLNTVWTNYLVFIQDRMNFRFRITYAKEGEYKLNGSKRFEIDLRAKVFDSLPINVPILGLVEKSPVHLHVRYDEILENNKISKYTRPFSINLWIAILISTAAIGLCTLIIVYTNISDFGLIDACYHPLEALFNQDAAESPKSIKIRIAIMTARFVAMFLVPAYSAFLLTFILNPNIKLPFTDLESFLKDGSYEMGFSVNSGLDEWFQESNDSLFKTIYKKYLLKPNKRPLQNEDIYEEICHFKKVAFATFHDITTVANCKIIKLKKPITTAWLGLYLRKESPYKKFFDRIMKKYITAGFHDRFHRVISRTELFFKNHYLINDFEPVKIENTAAIFQLLALLYISAIAILFLECQYKKLVPLIRKVNLFQFAKKKFIGVKMPTETVPEIKSQTP